MNVEGGSCVEPIFESHLNKACADLAQQTEAIHSKLSRQIEEQASGICQQVANIKDQLCIVQAELRSTSGNVERLLKVC